MLNSLRRKNSDCCSRRQHNIIYAKQRSFKQFRYSNDRRCLGTPLIPRISSVSKSTEANALLTRLSKAYYFQRTLSPSLFLSFSLQPIESVIRCQISFRSFYLMKVGAPKAKNSIKIRTEVKRIIDTQLLSSASRPIGTPADRRISPPPPPLSQQKTICNPRNSGSERHYP